MGASSLTIDQVNAGEIQIALPTAETTPVVKLSEVSSSNGLVQAALAGVLYGLPPIMNAAGVALGIGAHIVVGVVVASGTTTSVTFSGAAAFTSASSFVALVVDLSVASGTYISCNGVSPTGISWVSVNTHEYVYLAIGY